MRARLSHWAIVGLVLASVLGACSSRTARQADVRPRDVSNLCTIFQDNPHWAEAALAAHQRWNTPIDVKMAIIWRESTFRPAVRPVRYVMGVPAGYASSAFGFAQAIDGTWAWYQENTGNHRADRTNFADAIDFVGWYMTMTARLNGLSFYDARNQYLAYHEGHTGFDRGSWRAKGFVQRAASQVAEQAALYRAQAAYCPPDGRTRRADGGAQPPRG